MKSKEAVGLREGYRPKKEMGGPSREGAGKGLSRAESDAL